MALCSTLATSLVETSFIIKEWSAWDAFTWPSEGSEEHAESEHTHEEDMTLLI